MPEQLSSIDIFWMRRALELAEEAASVGEVPVGAVVVKDGREVASGCNQVERCKDACAHAEMLALGRAAEKLGDWRLDECTLYVTKEPCAMCAGAAVNSRLGRLVFGVRDERSGGAGGALDITGFPGMLHRVEVTGGILAEECLECLQSFFRRRREQVKNARRAAAVLPEEAEQ